LDCPHAANRHAFVFTVFDFVYELSELNRQHGPDVSAERLQCHNVPDVLFSIFEFDYHSHHSTPLDFALKLPEPFSAACSLKDLFEASLGSAPTLLKSTRSYGRAFFNTARRFMPTLLDSTRSLRGTFFHSVVSLLHSMLYVSCLGGQAAAEYHDCQGGKNCYRVSHIVTKVVCVSSSNQARSSSHGACLDSVDRCVSRLAGSDQTPARLPAIILKTNMTSATTSSA
jgi:hypothetical protein